MHGQVQVQNDHSISLIQKRICLEKMKCKKRDGMSKMTLIVEPGVQIGNFRLETMLPFECEWQPQLVSCTDSCAPSQKLLDRKRAAPNALFRTVKFGI